MKIDHICTPQQVAKSHSTGPSGCPYECLTVNIPYICQSLSGNTLSLWMLYFLSCPSESRLTATRAIVTSLICLGNSRINSLKRVPPFNPCLAATFLLYSIRTHQDTYQLNHIPIVRVVLWKTFRRKPHIDISCQWHGITITAFTF